MCITIWWCCLYGFKYLEWFIFLFFSYPFHSSLVFIRIFSSWIIHIPPPTPAVNAFGPQRNVCDFCILQPLLYQPRNMKLHWFHLETRSHLYININIIIIIKLCTFRFRLPHILKSPRWVPCLGLFIKTVRVRTTP